MEVIQKFIKNRLTFIFLWFPFLFLLLTFDFKGEINYGITLVLCSLICYRLYLISYNNKVIYLLIFVSLLPLIIYIFSWYWGDVSSSNVASSNNVKSNTWGELLVISIFIGWLSANIFVLIMFIVAIIKPNPK